jgi:hypothetical protein
MIIFSEDEDNSSLSSSMEAIDEKQNEEKGKTPLNLMLDPCKLITDLKPATTRAMSNLDQSLPTEHRGQIYPDISHHQMKRKKSRSFLIDLSPQESKY